MPTLEWRVDRREGVTFVRATLRQRPDDPGDGPVRATVESRLDGDVWPPRSQGVPIDGWDGRRYRVTVPADRPVGVGFASPAPPTEPPVEIVDRTCVGGEGEIGVETAETAADSDDVLRALGDPSPPRDAVPVPDSGSGHDPGSGSDSDSDPALDRDRAAPEPADPREQLRRLATERERDPAASTATDRRSGTRER